MKEFSQKASELFKEGHSCSEAVVKAAYETGLVDKTIDMNTLNRIASPFSGAMGDHQCLCGAIAGSQIVIGLLYGRTDKDKDENDVKKIASRFNKDFKDKKQFTCCKALRSANKDPLKQGRAHCAGIVEEATAVLGNIIEERKCKV